MSANTKIYALIIGSIVQLSLLGINLLVTSKMSLPERGTYALIIAVLVTVSGLCNFGFANALIKRMHEDVISRSYFLSMLATIVIQSLIAILVAVLLLRSFPNVSDKLIYSNGFVMIFIVISLVMRVYLQSYLLGLNRIGHFQVSKMIPVFSFFFILYLRDQYDLTNVLFAWLMSEVILVVLLIAYVSSNLTLGNSGEAGSFRRDIRFGIKSMFGQASFIEGYKFDQIMIGYFLPLSEVAIYAVAKSVSLVLRFVPQSLSQIAYPAVLRAPKKEKLSVIRSFVFFSIAVSIGLIVVGQYLFDNFVISFIGEEYRDASRILFVLFMGVLAYAPRRILYEYFKAVNRPGITSIMEFLVLTTYVCGIGALLALDAVTVGNLAATILVVNVFFLLVMLRCIYPVNKTQ